MLTGNRTKEKYDSTLLLNCCVGLLVLPQQLWFDLLTQEPLVTGNWGVKDSDISLLGRNNRKDKTVQNLAYHLRNSISHIRFQAFSDSNNDIDRIIFKDYIDSSKRIQTLEAAISIDCLQTFLNKLSITMLDIMDQAK